MLQEKTEHVLVSVYITVTLVNYIYKGPGVILPAPGLTFTRPLPGDPDETTPDIGSDHSNGEAGSRIIYH